MNVCSHATCPVLKEIQGMQDEGLKSMKYETYGLAAGGALFLVGFLIERSTGGKS